MKENDLIENKLSREQLIYQVQVLDKVKELNLLPNTNYMTTKQVAEYYKVDQSLIRQINVRNEEELLEDGVKHFKHKEIKGLIGENNIKKEKISPNGSLFFTKKAVLRIGMLLRDSEVAKQIRKELILSNPILYSQLSSNRSFKKYEDDMYAYLIATFGKNNIKRQFYCDGYYIDFLIYDIIAIEVDENNHKGYIVINEEKKRVYYKREI